MCCVWTPNLKAKLLEAHPSVILIEPDWLFQKATTHRPEFLELLRRVWPLNGGADHAGEGIVIGMLDTSIDPKHPSTNEIQNHRYDPLDKWKGWYFVTDSFLTVLAMAGSLVLSISPKDSLLQSCSMQHMILIHRSMKMAMTHK
jgi:hypothetical protein